MEEHNLYSSYRFVSGAMNLLCSSLTHIVYLLTAPLLVFLARDFGLDNATAGYASTVHICFMGLFLFVGPVVIGKIDIRKTQILGVTLMLAGLFLSYIAKSFPLFLLSRAVTGVGHGISGSCNHSVVAAWFPPREKSAAVTVNSLGIVAVTTLVYTCAVPLYHAFGDSWRRVMLLTLGVLAAADALWILLYRDNHALNAHIAREHACSGRVVNAFSGMRQAVSRRDVWLVCLFMGLGSIASNGINTYLPQFLQTVRGYSDTAASAVVGVTAGIGAVGTFLGGALTTFLGRRKGVIVPCLAVSIVCLALSLVCSGAALISGFFFAYTLLTNFRTPASQTIATELPDSTPSLASAAAAMSYGVGFVGTFACAPLLKLSTALFGVEYSLLIYLPLFALSLLFVILVPETGPGRKKRDFAKN